MKFWLYGLVVLGALALGLGTIVLSDFMRPTKRLERKQQKHEEMIRVAQEKEKAELEKRQQIEKELERKRKEEERRLELKRKEEYARSKEGRFETAMDYYEGRNGKNMGINETWGLFNKLVGEGYPPAMNALACMYYDGEDPGQRRFSGSVDKARFWWEQAAAISNEAAKENINKLIRHR